MTPGAEWRPVTGEPRVRVSDDGQRVQMWTGAAQPVVLTSPWLDQEVVPWAKPSASVCFPLHPFGVRLLYGRACTLLDAATLADAERAAVDAWLARCAATTYRPGRSIRSCVDDAVAGNDLLPRRDQRDDPAVAGPAFLAAWLVVRAAITWAEDAS